MTIKWLSHITISCWYDKEPVCELDNNKLASPNDQAVHDCEFIRKLKQVPSSDLSLSLDSCLDQCQCLKYKSTLVSSNGSGQYTMVSEL